MIAMRASKESDMFYAIFATRLGWMGVLGSTAGLRRVVLPQTSPETVLRSLSQGSTPIDLDPSFLGDLPDRLSRYLRGERVSFHDPLDLSGATSFQRAVWRVTSTIPYGETRSYAWVARQMEMPGAARAVGQALARNPLPMVIPCHRVIGSSGNLRGFSGGLEKKRYLLEIESLIERKSSLGGEKNPSYKSQSLLRK